MEELAGDKKVEKTRRRRKKGGGAGRRQSAGGSLEQARTFVGDQKREIHQSNKAAGPDASS